MFWHPLLSYGPKGKNWKPWRDHCRPKGGAFASGDFGVCFKTTSFLCGFWGFLWVVYGFSKDFGGFLGLLQGFFYFLALLKGLLRDFCLWLLKQIQVLELLLASRY